jgi:hypothetical protein
MIDGRGVGWILMVFLKLPLAAVFKQDQQTLQAVFLAQGDRKASFCCFIAPNKQLCKTDKSRKERESEINGAEVAGRAALSVAG